MKRTSELFETLVHRIKIKSVNDDFYLVPFSDIHWGNDNFASSAWKRFCKWGRATPNALFVGNGDYLERYRAHTRADVQAAMKKDDELRRVLDERTLHDIEEFSKEIDFMRGRLVGLGDGNHAWEFPNGRNDTEVLCDMMGVPFLGVCCVILFQIEYHGMFVSFQYMQHHGVGGGGKTAGAQFNNLQDMANWTEGVSIFVMGDNHGLGAPPDTRLTFIPHSSCPGKLIPRDRTLYYIRSGGFTRYYAPGKRGYIVGRAAKPRPVGFSRIRVYLSRSKKDGLNVHFEAQTVAG